MPREVKAFLFTLFMIIFVGSFVVQWVATGSIMSALILVGQILLMFVSIILLFLLFMFVGLKIFHD